MRHARFPWDRIFILIVKNYSKRNSLPVMFKLKGFAILEVLEELKSLQDVYGQGTEVNMVPQLSFFFFPKEKQTKQTLVSLV